MSRTIDVLWRSRDGLQKWTQEQWPLAPEYRRALRSSLPKAISSLNSISLDSARLTLSYRRYVNRGIHYLDAVEDDEGFYLYEEVDE